MQIVLNSEFNSGAFLKSGYKLNVRINLTPEESQALQKHDLLKVPILDDPISENRTYTIEQLMGKGANFGFPYFLPFISFRQNLREKLKEVKNIISLATTPVFGEEVIEV